MSNDRPPCDFFNINIGHCLTIIIYLVTCGIAYGLIKGKVENLDTRLTVLENSTRVENPKITADLGEIKIRLTRIETTLDFIRQSKGITRGSFDSSSLNPN